MIHPESLLSQLCDSINTQRYVVMDSETWIKPLENNTHNYTVKAKIMDKQTGIITSGTHSQASKLVETAKTVMWYAICDAMKDQIEAMKE